MSTPEDKQKARTKRQRNFVAKHNKHKAYAHKPKTAYKREKFDPRYPQQEG